MEILFLNPPFKGRFSRTSRSPAVTKGGTLYYPVWLALAAGVAEKEGHSVQIFDAPASDQSLEDIYSKLGDFVPEIAVFDSSTGSLYSDVEVAKKVKEKFPSCFTVLVGTHPSAMPKETLERGSHLSAVAIREYDYTIPALAEALKNKTPLEQVLGIAFRQGDRIIQNPERPSIENLDEIPFASIIYKKYLNFHNYFFAAANYPVVQMMTGRGCPFKCNWCVYPQVFHSHRYRVRSAENVVDEFEYIVSNFHGIQEIGIEDDCFTADRPRLKKICELIIERNIKIKW